MELLPVNGASVKQEYKKVTLESFEYLKVLGKGSYGKVTLCRETSTQALYAMKVLKKEAVIENKDISNVLNEHEALQSTNHPFVTFLKYSFQTKDLLCFVMEYVGGGDLFFHLARVGQFNEHATRFYAAEITLAVGYLHSKGIIHRDLKTENILLDIDGHVRIADFGFCKQNMAYGRTTKSVCGTPEFLAPEVCACREYGRAVDWWSLGVTMYKMMYGTLPFEGDSFEILQRKIRWMNVDFPDTISVGARDILQRLLTKDPTQRLGGDYDDVSEVMMHFFFRDVDWVNVFYKRYPAPFKPQLSNTTDTQYFDEFPSESIKPTSSENSACMEVTDDYHFLNFSFQDTTFGQ